MEVCPFGHRLAFFDTGFYWCMDGLLASDEVITFDDTISNFIRPLVP